MAFVTFECRSCGAGVQSPPDNLLVVCAHCGDRYPSKEMGDIPIALIPSRSKQAIVDAVHDRMAKDKQMAGKQITIESAEGVYVPIFLTKAHISGDWKGYYKKKRDNSTVTVWEEGQVSEQMDFPILGRAHAYEFGMEIIHRVLFQQETVDFGTIDWASVALPVLPVDVDESTVELKVQDQLINTVGEKVRTGLNALTKFDVEVVQENRCIVLFPFWSVQYEYQGGHYRVAVSGGDGQVLAAMEPVFLGTRIGAWMTGVSALVVAGLACNGIYMVFGTMKGIDGGDIFVTIIVVICALITWFTADRLTASVHIDLLPDEDELS